MFEPIEAEPCGFLGRPLIATVFAAGLGTALFQVGSRFRLSDSTVFAIALVVVFVLGYTWERLETPRRDT